jgi:hypothetical protein
MSDCLHWLFQYDNRERDILGFNPVFGSAIGQKRCCHETNHSEQCY